MKNIRSAFLMIIAGIVTLIGSQSYAQSLPILISDKICNAVLVGPKTLRIPEHCVSRNAQDLRIEGLGSVAIDWIEPSVGFNLSPLDNILMIHLKTNALSSNGETHFVKAHVGIASTQKSGKQTCRVTKVDEEASVIYHTCFGTGGESGRVIYQDGKAVGIHLGRYDGLPIAALGDGSELDLGHGFDSALYEPQGFSIEISCCEKAEKIIGDLVDAVGDTVSDAGEGIRKTIGHLKVEIQRVVKDIETLPKSLSTEYIQDKTSAIKIPEIPQINVNIGDVKKKINLDDFLIIGFNAGVNLPILAAYDFDENRLKEDLDRELTNALNGITDALFGKDAPSCEAQSTPDIKNCKAYLEGEVEKYKVRLSRQRSRLDTYIQNASDRLRAKNPH